MNKKEEDQGNVLKYGDKFMFRHQYNVKRIEYD